MDTKLAIDAAVVSRLGVPLASPLWPGAVPQLAFLFLVMDGLDFPEVWDRFFADATASHYRIYVHRAAPGRERGAAAGPLPLPLVRWGAVSVGRVESGWCALVGVEVALLAAALGDPRNQQLVFVSHNTVPLKRFDYVYRQLVENSPATSKLCFAEAAWHRLATPETIRNELRRECVFRDFYRRLNPRTLKHHQWIVLARGHAEIFVRRAGEALSLWRESWDAAAPDLSHMGEGCSDEAVPGTALLQELRALGRSTGNTWADLARLGVEQQCLTYVLWRHCFTDTELDHSETIAKELGIVRRHGRVSMLTDKDFDFFQSALKRELNGYPAVFDSLQMEYLWKLANEGFMFARKFIRDIRVEADGTSFPLATVLPAMWDCVNEERASQRVWSRLSTAGAPRPI